MVFSCGDKAYTSLFPSHVNNRLLVISINMVGDGLRDITDPNSSVE